MAVIKLRNVSSPFRVKNSDYDLEAHLRGWLWKAIVNVLDTLSIGAYKREKAYRVSAFNAELFLLIADDLDEQSIAVYENNCTMRTWDDITAKAYMGWKREFEGMKDGERKHMKAVLASFFELNSKVYEA